jgi:hypothetical protein
MPLPKSKSYDTALVADAVKLTLPLLSVAPTAVIFKLPGAWLGGVGFLMQPPQPTSIDVINTLKIVSFNIILF